MKSVVVHSCVYDDFYSAVLMADVICYFLNINNIQIFTCINHSIRKTNTCISYYTQPHLDLLKYNIHETLKKKKKNSNIFKYLDMLCKIRDSN